MASRLRSEQPGPKLMQRGAEEPAAPGPATAGLVRHRLGNSDVWVTRCVLGLAPIGGLDAPVTDDEARAALEAAWDRGIRAFDTAPHYGASLSKLRLGS